MSPALEQTAAKAPVRLLVFLHSFETGGVESDALRLISALPADRVATHLVMGRATGPLKPLAPAVPTVILETGRHSTRRFETLWMILNLPAQVRRIRPDVILCAGNTYSIVAAALWLRLGRACPPIVLKVSNDLRRPDMPLPIRAIYHAWLRWQTRCFAAIVSMTAQAVPEIAVYMRAPLSKIETIPNGSITAASLARLAAVRKASTPQSAGRCFLAIGRLAPQKNFPLLLEAFARIATPADRLIIVGDGKQREKLLAQAKRLDISGQLDLPGYANPVDAYLAQADMLVLSSDYEGLGVVVIEALSAGLPVVATDCCVSMPSLIGRFGTLVPQHDAAALAKAMRAQAPLSAEDRAAAATAMSAFTVERAAPAYAALFARLAASRPEIDTLTP
jgi:glycosyltransferase involved in cell wall biosynthesis